MPRVLVIDDDRDLNAVIMESLAEEGCSCIAAFNHEHGFALLEQHSPDLVLLDLHGERTDGVEFLRRKAATATVAEIPVIVMTATPNPPKLHGTVATLLKPFTLEELFDVVKRFAPIRASIA